MVRPLFRVFIFWSGMLKGALDKCSIYLFVSNSMENYMYKINRYQTFQLILPMCFHFMRSFVNSIIPWVSHRPLCCVFIEVDFEKKKVIEKFIFLQKQVGNFKKNGFFYILPRVFFFMGETEGSPHPAKFCQFPPIRHLSPFLDQGLSLPAEVRPRKFEKSKYTFLCQIWLLLSSKVP